MYEGAIYINRAVDLFVMVEAKLLMDSGKMNAGGVAISQLEMAIQNASMVS